MAASKCHLLTYDTITHVLFGRIIPIKNETNQKNGQFPTENIKLVVVIIEIYFFKKASVRLKKLFSAII